MLVHESLTVTADSTHGTPFRDISLLRGEDAAARFDVDVMQVSRNGQRLPWDTAARDGFLRLYLGSPSRRVPAGRRTYEVLYHVDGHLARDGDSEWLLWRPLGAGGAAVSRLAVSVTFPRVLDAGSVRVDSAGGGRLASRVSRDGTVTFTSTAPLAAGEGPAILVGWPRGHLLTATDSELAPWMKPRATSLWWGVAGLAVLLFVAWRIGRPVPARAALPALSLLVSLVSLFAAGAAATRDATAFPAEFVLALAAAAFSWLARTWLDGACLRVAYIVVVTALASIVTVRWTITISPWFPLLAMAHVDVLAIIAIRARASVRERRRDVSKPAASRPPPPDSMPLNERDAPVLDRHAPAAPRDEHLPDGRRVPRLDVLGGWGAEPADRRGGTQSSSGRW